MLWIRCEENEFFKNLNKAVDFLKENNLLPSVYKTKILTASDFQILIDKNVPNTLLLKRAVISPFYPDELGFKNYGFFTLIEIPNKYGYKTSEQDVIDDNVILSENLGLNVTTPAVTFKDMAGAKKLLEDANAMIKLENLNRPIGGLFLFGVPGTGKSYFAECFAGETKRKLVELDLSFIINTPNPTRTIDNIFNFLFSQKNEKFVLWIDEIEKMYDLRNLKAKQVFGKLLTKLNEVAKNELKNIVFVATANKIEDIMKNNPEFLRKGRFRKLYFLNFPKAQDALEIISFYLKRARAKFERDVIETLKGEINLSGGVFEDLKEVKNGKKEVKSVIEKYSLSISPEELIGMLDTYFFSRPVKERFVYTPSEIKVFIDEISDLKKIGLSDKEAVETALKEVVPIQITMKDAINSMISQARSAEGGSRIFVEI